MKLLTTILILTSLSAFSGLIPEGIATKSTRVTASCVGVPEKLTYQWNRYLPYLDYPERKRDGLDVTSEISFWGEGKIRAKIELKGVMGQSFSFSFVGIDNGFGEYTLYKTPNDIANNNPANIALQIYPKSISYDLKDDMLINKSYIFDRYNVHGYFCLLQKGTNLSLSIESDTSATSQEDE
ncbi:MAG: hypothetical protein KC478_09975 [Bacteriovoracaceae bacterium]|nr:hypothetical protein [Bacteriovoracaceae bacterium]